MKIVITYKMTRSMLYIPLNYPQTLDKHSQIV